MTNGQEPDAVGSTYILEMTGDDPRLGLGLLLPEEVWLVVGYSSRPADRWNLDSRLTTLVEVCVLTPIGPPYGVIGKICEVPLNVDTATHLESGLKAMSCTEPGVSPRYKE